MTFHRPLQRRFPVSTLSAVLRSESVSQLARTCRIDRAQMNRYIRDGLPETAADRIAVRCGLHPAEVWSDWFEAVA